MKLTLHWIQVEISVFVGYPYHLMTVALIVVKQVSKILWIRLYAIIIVDSAMPSSSTSILPTTHGIYIVLLLYFCDFLQRIGFLGCLVSVIILCFFSFNILNRYDRNFSRICNRRCNRSCNRSNRSYDSITANTERILVENEKKFIITSISNTTYTR